MRKTLHCKSCFQFLVVITRKNLVCIDYENSSLVYAFRNHVKKQNLFFDKYGSVHCSKCKLFLGTFRGFKYVIFRRYKLIMIEKFDKIFYTEENYDLPEMGLDFMDLCFRF